MMLGSTIGGFLLGVGLMVLLISSAGLYGVQTIYQPTYEEVMGYKLMVQEFYGFTHSPVVEEMLGGYDELLKLIPTLEMFVDSYDELAGSISQAGSMVESYREVVALMPELEGMVQNYAEVYPKIMKYKDEVEAFYVMTYSEDYNETLEALKELSESWPIEEQANYTSMVYQYMIEAQYWSALAYNTFETMEMLPPEKVEGYVSQIKRAMDAYPPEKVEAYISQATELVNAFPPDRAKAYVSRLKGFIEAFPPSKVNEYLVQAKGASEKALEAVNMLEAYPPSKVSTFLLIAAIAGASLTGFGLLIMYKARNPSGKANTSAFRTQMSFFDITANKSIKCSYLGENK